jgi:hypothetical protein
MDEVGKFIFHTKSKNKCTLPFSKAPIFEHLSRLFPDETVEARKAQTSGTQPLCFIGTCRHPSFRAKTCPSPASN